MATLSQIKKRWLKNPRIKQEYEQHAQEFEIANALLKARLAAGYSQNEVAQRMKTTQSVIARMESGSQLPSLRSIFRYAKAIGAHASVEIHT